MMRYWLILALVCLSFKHWCHVSGAETQQGGAYLHCVVQFHQYLVKSTRYIHDLRDRVKCHEDWIDSQAGRIRDLEALNLSLRHENDHLWHVIHVLHYHFRHLHHSYISLRDHYHQCQQALDSC